MPKDLRKVLLRALNKNQILILSEIKTNSIKTITSLLTDFSIESKIPLSTLKLNAKILKELNLITFTNFSNVELTESGEFILQIIGGDKDV